MALFHAATVQPTKAEAIAEWIPTRPWGPPPNAEIEVIGSYRFDDPDGRVGLESFLVEAAGSTFHVPLTYRDEPLAGAGLITEMEHTALGTRWVYDGLSDPLYVTMLASISLTGQGEALGMALYEGRWYIAPTNVRVTGGGWTLERVPVDGFEMVSDDETTARFSNGQFDLAVAHRPRAGEQPTIGLTARWETADSPVILTEVRQR